jgi:hypothetical protein
MIFALRLESAKLEVCKTTLHILKKESKCSSSLPNDTTKVYIFVLMTW